MRATLCWLPWGPLHAQDHHSQTDQKEGTLCLASSGPRWLQTAVWPGDNCEMKVG